jgi:hypothetical protein
VNVLFDDEVWVHYRFLYLQPTGTIVDDADSRRGQVNGLVGAAQAGVLFITTGLHTGHVPVRVEWHDAEPAFAEGWEDVVEASFTPDDDEYELRTFQDAYPVGELLPTSHRARWHTTGMDAAWQADTVPRTSRMSTATCSNAGLLPQRRTSCCARAARPTDYWHSEAARGRERRTPRRFVDSRTYLGAELRSFIDRRLADG